MLALDVLYQFFLSIILCQLKKIIYFLFRLKKNKKQFITNYKL